MSSLTSLSASALRDRDNVRRLGRKVDSWIADRDLALVSLNLRRMTEATMCLLREYVAWASLPVNLTLAATHALAKLERAHPGDLLLLERIRTWVNVSASVEARLWAMPDPMGAAAEIRRDLESVTELVFRECNSDREDAPSSPGTAELSLALEEGKKDANGVLIRVELENTSLEAWRMHGASTAEERALLAHAWEARCPCHSRLPGAPTAWAKLEFVAHSSRKELAPLAPSLLASLSKATQSHSPRWRVMFIEAQRGAPERTLACDPEYDLEPFAGRSVVVWVTPYAGGDWREPGRYPTVEVLASTRARSPTNRR
jgi:hypothetical protein